MIDLRRAGRGFTLLETLVALAILGLGVTAVLELIGASSRAAARTQATTEAVFVAQDIMEELETLNEADLRDRRGEAGLYADLERRRTRMRAPRLALAESPVATRYTYALNVDPEPVQPGLYRVDVEVRWPGGGRLELTTLRRFRPPEANQEGIL